MRFRKTQGFSSQPRYDHFDTSPYVFKSIQDKTNYLLLFRTGRPVMSCCVARNFCSLLASQNFDRCHSLRLASSPTGCARRRPHFDTSPNNNVCATSRRHYYTIKSKRFQLLSIKKITSFSLLQFLFFRLRKTPLIRFRVLL